MSVDKVGNYFFYVHAKQEYDNGKTKLQSDLFFFTNQRDATCPAHFDAIGPYPFLSFQ